VTSGQWAAARLASLERVILIFRSDIPRPPFFQLLSKAQKERERYLDNINKVIRLREQQVRLCKIHGYTFALGSRPAAQPYAPTPPPLNVTTYYTGEEAGG
jgi:hypothetical protein